MMNAYWVLPTVKAHSFNRACVQAVVSCVARRRVEHVLGGLFMLHQDNLNL